MHFRNCKHFKFFNIESPTNMFYEITLWFVLIIECLELIIDHFTLIKNESHPPKNITKTPSLPPPHSAPV